MEQVIYASGVSVPEVIQDGNKLLESLHNARFCGLESDGGTFYFIIKYEERTVEPKKSARICNSRLHCEDCKYWQGDDGSLVGFCSQRMRNTRRDKKESTCKFFSNVAEVE